MVRLARYLLHASKLVISSVSKSLKNSSSFQKWNKFGLKFLAVYVEAILHNFILLLSRVEHVVQDSIVGNMYLDKTSWENTNFWPRL